MILKLLKTSIPNKFSIVVARSLGAILGAFLVYVLLPYLPFAEADRRVIQILSCGVAILQTICYVVGYVIFYSK